MPEETQFVRRLVGAMRSDLPPPTRPAILSLRPEDRPSSLDEAEAVQDAVLARLAWPAGAWKLGATTVAARQALGLNRFFSGLVPAERVLVHPAALSRSALRQAGVECEIALHFARDLPPRATPYGPSEIRAALLGVHPAFEIPQTRYGALGAEGAFALVADNGAAGWAVCGPGRALSEVDPDAPLSVTLRADGIACREGDTGVLLDRPLSLVTDHVNRMGRRGHATRAGEVVLTGSLTPYHPCEAPATLTADFGPLGEVSLTLVD